MKNEVDDLKQFKELLEEAFQKNPQKALEGSVKLARFCGVPDEKLVHNIQEIDNLFLK